MMLSADFEDKYLRPRALRENLDSSTWSDSSRLWIPDKEHGFICVKVIEPSPESALPSAGESDSAMLKVETDDGAQQVISGKNAMACNAARYDRYEDMTEMGELNEATILNNLRRRYSSNLIYTYSGLFLVAVNPYRNIPIYDENVISWYKNQKRKERPPHVFAIADSAYRAMLETHQNQSILITGESGAGKTENTKKVIQYIASIASTGNDRSHTAGNPAAALHANSLSAHALEQQIILTNPILESFGNAQTIRNNNSSRFGKFIRIEFNQAGNICGANIERYLLEKSRVTHRTQKERNFHIFYQFLSGASAELKESLMIKGGLDDYAYTKNSNKFIEGVDDREDFLNLMESMRVVGFSEKDQNDFFRIIAAILHLGNLTFDEDEQGQARVTSTEAVQSVCAVLGVPLDDFVAALLNPVIRAGKDVVAQARDVAQVIYSVEALSRTLYDRMFSRLVQRINASIDKNTTGKATFIGVLDLAGFEIFEKNSFEQLCINYTNEKLQQFFNHHMFIIEQEEYKRENLEWNYIDFGLDLQPTIDLIEKSNPVGILACLDEDCVVPRATDKSFTEKVSSMWKGKSSKFDVPRFGNGIIIQHYAGRVEYATEGWLDKNKDPLNENVTRMLARSTDSFVANTFSDFSGTEEDIYQNNRGGKKGVFRTVAQKHRESLAMLMQQLYSTRPHFVRCIIPNEDKKAGKIDAALVLDQLRCNGVLEGIRICRQGYPNRLPFGDFTRIYEILSTSTLPSDTRTASRMLLEQLDLKEGEHFRFGSSKIFFKAGQLTKLDEIRDRKLSTILKTFQAHCRGVLARHARLRRSRQQEAIMVLQRNARLFLRLREWAWWRLYSRVKPLLNVTRAENRIEELEAEIARITSEREGQTGQLRGELEKERNNLYEVETRRRELERENQQLALQLSEANEAKVALMERKMAQEVELVRLRERISSELEAQRDEAQGKLAAQMAEAQELRRTIEENATVIQGLKAQMESLEFDKIRLEKSENVARQRFSEMESIMEDARRARKDLENRLRVSEDSRRALQEQLDDESQEQARRREIQIEHDQQMKAVKQQHEQQYAEQQDEFEQIRKRLQREIHQLTFDLEQEKKQSASHKDIIKRYESGADSLATQLEAEVRSQNAWKREKERLEGRLKELVKINADATDREDVLQSQLVTSSEQIRDLRHRISDLEELFSTVEKQKKSIDGRFESLNEQYKEALAVRQSQEKTISMLEMKLSDATSRLNDEQDALMVQAERLRTTELICKLSQAELTDERKRIEEMSLEKSALEAQIKDLQLKLLESETQQTCGSSRQSFVGRGSSVASIISQLETDSAERQNLIKDNRRYERLTKDLQQQISDRDRERIYMEESIDKAEIKLRKLQTRVEELETANNDLEIARRRTERDITDEREKSERFARELEKVKGRMSRPTISDDVLG